MMAQCASQIWFGFGVVALPAHWRPNLALVHGAHPGTRCEALTRRSTRKADW